jgi:hypothetical protein
LGGFRDRSGFPLNRKIGKETDPLPRRFIRESGRNQLRIELP